MYYTSYYLSLEREVRRRVIGAQYTQPREIRRVGGGTPCGCVLIRQTLERLYDMGEMRNGTGDCIASRENARMAASRSESLKLLLLLWRQLEV
jgi:hypothetical protein